MEHTNNDRVRLERVESEVSTIREDVGGLKADFTAVKADVRGLGSILQRIENGISKSQDQALAEKERGRPNLIAVVSVLITILVGGAWTIGGKLGQLDERSAYHARELDQIERRGNQIDEHTWQLRGADRGRPSS